MRRAIGAALLLGAACGGGDSVSPPPPPPPSAPVVTAVQVSPVSAPLFMTDTLQLTATVKDQFGAVMTEKSVSWSSGSPAIATVTNDGRVIGVAVGTAVITASVEGKSGSATLTVSDPGPRISLEQSTAAAQTIGTQGGSVTTTSAAGVTYTLDVPAGALMSPHQITITPITGVRKFPLSGGFVGGVEFQPAGLAFAIPARLRVQIRQRPAGGFRLIAVRYEGNGAQLVPTPAADSGTVAVIPVPHFSGVGAGFGTTSELSALLLPLVANPALSQTYINQLIQLATATPQDGVTILQVMRDWLNLVIRPMLQNADNDLKLIAAVGELTGWLDAPLTLGLAITGLRTQMGSDWTATEDLLASKLHTAIDGNNTVCRNQQNLTALANVLYWQQQAAEWQLDTPPQGLDRPSVLAGLCAHVILESSTLAAPLLETGLNYPFVAHFRLQFEGQPTAQAQQFEVAFVDQGLTVTPANGVTPSSGDYSATARPAVNGTVVAAWEACLNVPGRPDIPDVCSQGTLSRSSQDPPPPPPPPPSGTFLTQITAVQDFTTVNGICNIQSGAQVMLPGSAGPAGGSVSGRWEQPAFFGICGIHGGSVNAAVSISPSFQVSASLSLTFDDQPDGTKPQPAVKTCTFTSTQIIAAFSVDGFAQVDAWAEAPGCNADGPLPRLHITVSWQTPP